MRNAALAAPPPASGGWLWTALIAVTIVSTVFNDFPELLPAGEMSRDPFVLLFPVLLVGMLLQPGSVRLPVTLSAFLFVLAAVTVAGVAANYEEIATSFLKGRSGISRVVSQGMILAFGFAVSLVVYNLVMQGRARTIFAGARWGLIVMAAIGALEFASWFNVPGPTQAYDALSRLIHFDNYAFYPTRLRSTAFEVSWAAIFLAFLFPFAAMSVSGWRRTIVLVVIAVMAGLAQSRTGMLAIGLQFVLYFLLVSRHRVDRLIYVATALSAGLCALFFVPGAIQEIALALSNLAEFGSIDGPYEGAASDVNVSNLTRLTHLRVGMEMFADSPVFGVGLGQYGFYYSDYIRAADLRSWEVREYLLSGALNPEWPPSYSTHVRMLAEMGSVGFAIWISMVVLPLIRCIRRADIHTEAGRIHLAVSVGLLGWLLLTFSIDSLRFFGGWIALGVAYAALDLDREPHRAPPARGARV